MSTPPVQPIPSEAGPTRSRRREPFSLQDESSSRPFEVEVIYIGATWPSQVALLFWRDDVVAGDDQLPFSVNGISPAGAFCRLADFEGLIIAENYAFFVDNHYMSEALTLGRRFLSAPSISVHQEPFRYAYEPFSRIQNCHYPQCIMLLRQNAGPPHPEKNIGCETVKTSLTEANSDPCIGL